MKSSVETPVRLARRGGRLVVTLGLTISVFLSGCNAQKDEYQETRTIMGTYVTITAEYGALPEMVVRGAVADAFSEIELMDRLVSVYKEGSELSRINAMAGVGPVGVSPLTADAVRAALDISASTGGAFDPTVGPLVRLWSAARETGELPSDEEIKAAMALVDYRMVEVSEGPDGPTVSVRMPGMSLDLGGAAKGFAADLAADKLRERGVKAGIVAVAGDISLFGRRADGEPWRIGIQHPRDKDAVIAKVDITDAATSTSGDYERFFIKDGVRYHHILDPRTGYPASGLISVSVVAPKAALADPLATSLFAMGPEKAKEYARGHPEIEALMVTDNGDIIATGRFEGMDIQAINIQ